MESNDNGNCETGQDQLERLREKTRTLQTEVLIGRHAAEDREELRELRKKVRVLELESATLSAKVKELESKVAAKNLIVLDPHTPE